MRIIILCVIIMLTVGCNWLTEAVAPNDSPIYHTDTIPDPPEEIVEACDTVIVFQPHFITIYNEYFNGMPDTLTWYFHVGPGLDLGYPTLIELLVAIEFMGYIDYDSLEYYENGNSIAAILRGTNDKSGIETRIWTRDAIGQKAVFTVNVQSFLFGGALTFDEYISVAERYPSVNIFNFRNTNWTQDQYEEAAKIILGECKLGRERADFRFNALPISDQLYCEFIDRGWQFVLGQTPNCSQPASSKPTKA